MIDVSKESGADDGAGGINNFDEDVGGISASTEDTTEGVDLKTGAIDGPEVTVGVDNISAACDCAEGNVNDDGDAEIAPGADGGTGNKAWAGNDADVSADIDNGSESAAEEGGAERGVEGATKGTDLGKGADKGVNVEKNADEDAGICVGRISDGIELLGSEIGEGWSSSSWECAPTLAVDASTGCKSEERPKRLERRVPKEIFRRFNVESEAKVESRRSRTISEMSPGSYHDAPGVA